MMASENLIINSFTLVRTFRVLHYHLQDGSYFALGFGRRYRFAATIRRSGYSTRLTRPPRSVARMMAFERDALARVGASSRASDKGWSRRAAGRQRIRGSNMAAATSVVVLDRGNNTTCTINLHGVCACVGGRVRAYVCRCVACMYMNVLCGYVCVRARIPQRKTIESRDEMTGGSGRFPRTFRASRVYRCRCQYRVLTRLRRDYVRSYVRARFVCASALEILAACGPSTSAAVGRDTLRHPGASSRVIVDVYPPRSLRSIF